MKHSEAALKRSRGFALTAILVTALGVGAPGHRAWESRRFGRTSVLQIAEVCGRELATGAEADAREVAAPHSGLKVTGVIAGLPGDKAGLQPGDLIVEFANQQFRRDEGLAKLMAMHREALEGKHGSTLPLKVVRGKTRLDLVMNLR